MFTLDPKWFRLFTLLPFFVASFATALGNGAEYVAGTWSAVSGANQIPHELFRVMFYMFCFWLPTMTVGPIMGSIVDRFKRQHCYFGANLLGVLITGGFALWFYLEPTNAWTWPLLLIGMGFLFSLRFPSGNALVQELAKPEDLLLVNACAGITFELGNLVGNAAGGWLVAYFSIPLVLAAVCACFVFASITSSFLPESTEEPPKNDKKNSTLSLYKECFECLRFLKNNRRAGVLAILQMLLITCFMTNPVFLASFVKNILHESASYFGLLETLISVSFIISSFVLGFLRRQLGAENALILLLFIMLMAFMALFTHPTHQIGLIAYSLIGFGFASWSLSSTLVFESSPKEIQGRIQALISSATGLTLVVIDAIVLPFTKHIAHPEHLFIVMLALIGLVLITLVYLKTTESGVPVEEAA